MKNTNPAEELERLIKRAKSGDRAAISTLYEQHVDRIYRYIAYRVPGDDAEDITADVFVRMIAALPQYNYTGVPFEAWLYRIAAARVADYHRSSTRRQHDEIPDHLSDNLPLPEEHLEDKQEADKIRDALRGLSEEEQTILILRFVERKSHKEVAELLGKSVSAVRTTQHRALTRLSQFMDAEGKARHYLRGIIQPPVDDDE